MDLIFYELTSTSMEKTLPKLLEKIYDTNQKAVVLIDSEERLETINASLWTYSTLAFLPHGCAKDSNSTSDRQPIWLTTKIENPNHAEVLLITSGAIFDDNCLGFKKCLDIFDSNIPDNLQQAQKRYQFYQNKGYPCVYWRQTLEGRWETANP